MACPRQLHSRPQAKITQQANLAAGKRAPPVWALMMILFLGWNEFVAVVWNPIYLVLGLVGFVFGYMLYAELDVDARMQQGWITGLLSIWSGFGDALRSVSLWVAGVAPALLATGMESSCGDSQSQIWFRLLRPRCPAPAFRSPSGPSAQVPRWLGRGVSCWMNVCRAAHVRTALARSAVAAAVSMCPLLALCAARSKMRDCSLRQWVAAAALDSPQQRTSNAPRV